MDFDFFITVLFKGSPDSEKLKLKTIAEIKEAGFEVEKIIINYNLTESEAFAAEAALINAFNYVSDIGLTNIVAGHHSVEALNVENFERINGAVDYVFGVYNSLIVTVYKPSEWFICKDAKDKLPRQDIELTSKTENRVLRIR